MSEFAGTLITFVPLLLLAILANLADRARKRAQIQSDSGLLADDETIATSASLLTSTALEEERRVAAESLDVTFFDASTTTDADAALGLPVESTQSRAPVPASGSEGTIFAALAYLFLGGIYGLTAFFAILLLFAASMQGSAAELLATMEPTNIPLLGWGALIAALLGMAVLLRPVRSLLARFLPIDPLSTVHAVALSMTALVLLQTVFIIGISLEAMANLMLEAAEETGESGAVTVLGTWFSALMMVLLGAFGVGWVIRRNGRETLQRLGITMPTIRQTLISILLGALMVGVIYLLEYVSVQMGWGIDEDVERLTEQLLGGLVSIIPGVLTIGLAAGIGEETLMRGAVQPRFGLLLTSVLFALLHANYGITLSTLAVLIVGLVLGIVRQRMNTTSAMVLHATYNIILGLISFFAVSNL